MSKKNPKALRALLPFATRDYRLLFAEVHLADPLDAELAIGPCSKV